jgi:hypothetical protein
MNNFGHDLTSLMVHQARQQELIEQAENERLAKSVRQKVEHRVRRALRINNDPAR